MIVITGATGQLGSRVVNHLLDRVPADQLAVSVRTPEKADDLAARGVRVRHGDYAAPDSLVDAFEGADQVLIVSASATGGSAVEQHAAAVGAARDAGASRVLYTSHQAASLNSHFEPMPDHAATEANLVESGQPFVALRNGFYANFLPNLIRGSVETGRLLAPADGPVSWTTHDDLAEAAAIILADGGILQGLTPPLTGAEAIDLEGIADLLTSITGQTITRVVLPDEEFESGLVGRGVPAARADMLMGMFRASRSGEFSLTDPALASLLGRPTTAVRSVLEAVVAET